jgi:transcriptional regulator with XRE-family HTH domain
VTDRLNFLGKKLKLLRKDLGYSRSEVKENLGISTATLRNWEDGITEPGVINLGNYLNFYKEQGVHVTVDTLIDTQKPLEAKKTYK